MFKKSKKLENKIAQKEKNSRHNSLFPHIRVNLKTKTEMAAYAMATHRKISAVLVIAWEAYKKTINQ